MKEAVEASRTVGGRISQTKLELSQRIDMLENKLLEERHMRKRLEKQLEKQQEQINMLIKAVGIQKEEDQGE